MKKIIISFVILLSSNILLSKTDILLIDNFDSCSFTNSLGLNSGVWVSDPNDSSIYCNVSFDEKNRHGREGFSLAIDYNIESKKSYATPPSYTISQPAVIEKTFCSYFTKLNVNLDDYEYILFYIKGDKEKPFPTNLNIEIKDSLGRPYRYKIENITSEWQKILLPVSIFSVIEGFKNITELSFVFDHTLDRKFGKLYIDDIYFVSKPNVEIFAEFVSSYVKDKIVIDGIMEEDYKYTKSLSLDKKNLEYGMMSKENNVFAKVYSLWDKKKLYFFVEVVDNQVLPEDGINLFFDTNNDGFRYGSKDNFEFVFNFDSEKVYDGVEYRFVKTQVGYNFETAIDFEKIGVSPSNEKILGFTVAVKNKDKRHTSRLNWFYQPKEDKIQLGEMILK